MYGTKPPKLNTVHCLQVSAIIQDQLQEEHHDPQRMMENIKELAHHLYLNVSFMAAVSNV